MVGGRGAAEVERLRRVDGGLGRPGHAEMGGGIPTHRDETAMNGAPRMGWVGG